MTSKCRSSTNWGSKNRSISLSLAGRRPASCGPLCVNNSYYYSTRTCRFRMGNQKNGSKNSQSLHLTFHRNCSGGYETLLCTAFSPSHMQAVFRAHMAFFVRKMMIDHDLRENFRGSSCRFTRLTTTCPFFVDLLLMSEKP